VINATAVEGTRTTHNPVHLIALFQQLLSHVRPILTCYTRDESTFTIRHFASDDVVNVKALPASIQRLPRRLKTPENP
jgi:hypothetical protein